MLPFPFFVRPTEFSCRPAELACLTHPVADAVAPEGAIASPVNPGGVVHPGQLPELTPNERVAVPSDTPATELSAVPLAISAHTFIA